jgi:hypothetical protein
MKNYFVIFTFIAFLIPCTSQSQKLNPDDQIERYCGVVSALGEAILSARDKGMKMEQTRKAMFKVDIVAQNEQLQKDVNEILTFVYVTAPNTPRKKLSDFILNDWCLNQLR